MTDVNTLITEIETETERLDEYADDLQAILESGDTEERQEVAEMLQDSARAAPSIVAGHTDLLETALHDDDPTVQRFGAVATANVCNTNPEIVAEFVDALVEAYPMTGHYYSEQGAIIRALGIIGNETSTSLCQFDSWFAELLRDNDGIAPSEVAENIGAVVVDAPHEYPATVQALIAALDNVDPRTRSSAMKAVSLIARDDVTALPEPDRALDAVTQLHDHRDIDTNAVNRAIRMIRTGLNKREPTRSG